MHEKLYMSISIKFDLNKIHCTEYNPQQQIIKIIEYVLLINFQLRWHKQQCLNNQISLAIDIIYIYIISLLLYQFVQIEGNCKFSSNFNLEINKQSKLDFDTSYTQMEYQKFGNNTCKVMMKEVFKKHTQNQTQINIQLLLDQQINFNPLFQGFFRANFIYLFYLIYKTKNMLSKFIFKNLQQVPNTYKCLHCLQIPQNPVLDTKYELLICQEYFPQKIIYCDLQAYPNSRLYFKYNFTNLKEKTLKHSYLCLLSIQTDYQIYLEQQLLKSHHDFQCNKCQNVQFIHLFAKIAKIVIAFTIQVEYYDVINNKSQLISKNPSNYFRTYQQRHFGIIYVVIDLKQYLFHISAYYNHFLELFININCMKNSKCVISFKFDLNKIHFTEHNSNNQIIKIIEYILLMSIQLE
ncbi:hypothetical protein pb186bvf_003923 [Paramecium bursaria]